jgi:hypothetical protein
MDWLVGIGTTVRGLLVVVTAIISFVAWKRVGFKAPMYIHLIAFIAGFFGVLLAYMGHASGAEHGHKALWLVVAFPICTYLFFGLFGGGIVMADRELKERQNLDR